MKREREGKREEEEEEEEENQVVSFCSSRSRCVSLEVGCGGSSSLNRIGGANAIFLFFFFDSSLH